MAEDFDLRTSIALCFEAAPDDRLAGGLFRPTTLAYSLLPRIEKNIIIHVCRALAGRLPGACRALAGRLPGVCWTLAGSLLDACRALAWRLTGACWALAARLPGVCLASNVVTRWSHTSRISACLLSPAILSHNNGFFPCGCSLRVVAIQKSSLTFALQFSALTTVSIFSSLLIRDV
jgi:hypothetical protein